MNVALAAMLGMSLAQPPAATQDYIPSKQRKLTIPIQYTPKLAKDIRHVELFASNDGGQVWQPVASAPPTQNYFSYTAPADGLYCFLLVYEDLKGNKTPANPAHEQPDLKMRIDTRPPAVVFTNAKRTGDEITVEWKIDDQFPKDEATRLYIRPVAMKDAWKEVTLPADARNGVRFKPGIAGPIVVRVDAQDMVGHKCTEYKEIGAHHEVAGNLPAAGATLVSGTFPPVDVNIAIGGPAPGSMAMLPPTPPVAPPAPLMPPPVSPSNPLPTMAVPPPNLAPPNLAPPNIAPPNLAPPNLAPPSIAPPNLAPPTPPAPIIHNTPPREFISSYPAPSNPSAHVPIPTFDPRTTLTPVSGNAAPTGPVIEASRAPVINALRFDLNYQVEQRGPSGISRVDLWVTRDDGKSWVWWSKHDGREAAVKVNLNTESNTHQEGLYGFRLVPVSGAGLSDAVPTLGDAPDLRVMVDISAPTLKIFPAVADSNSPDALVLQWEAADKNFGDDPIVLEWCETAGGPWRPVAAAASETPGGPMTAKHLPNTGRHSWHVPAGLPPRVYLKVTAKDAAGNTTEQVTREPILIDLTKPRAKITGLGAGPFITHN